MRSILRGPTPIALCVLALLAALAAAPTLRAQASFDRGDCNADGAINVGDPIFLLAILFSSGPPGPCTDACDVNDDGGQDIGDAIYALAYLFSNGPDPLSPFGACGPDPTGDPLPCAAFPPCGAVEICDNNIDDDLDGAIDCADPDCAAFPACAPVEICDNNIDDDLDGDIDCADSDCAAFPACAPMEICDNNIDDDLDGAIDCADTDCAAAPNCQGGLSHATDIQPIWTANCVLCHTSPLPPQGLLLTAGNAFGMIVGIPSVECPPLDRIEPGLPQQSFLFRKINGTQAGGDVLGLGCTAVGVGAQMPFGPTCCLSQGDRDLIEAWIIDGANP